MATRTPKKLAQSALTNSLVAIYTVPALTTSQVVEVWLSNTNATTARVVTIAVHGNATANQIVPGLSIPALDFKVIDNAKIVLTAGEILYAKIDTGSDVNITIYGLEEV
jgi:NAD/NADP transhydrogenase alpha subunit